MPGSNEYSLAAASLGYSPSGNNVPLQQSVPSSIQGMGSSGGISIDPVHVASNIFNTIAQLYTNKKNRQFAAQQAKLQNQWNIEQWMRENAYNTPAAQMQRFIDAGLNPNLVLGQQNLAASSPQMVSAKDAPAGVAPQLSGASALQAAQIRNLNTNSELQEKSFEKTDAEIKAIFKGIDVDDADIALMQSTIDLYQKNGKQLDALADYYSQYTKNLSVEERASNLKFLLDSQLFETYVKQAQIELDLSEKQADMFVRTAIAQIVQDYASASYLNSEAGLNEPKTGAKWRLLRAQGDGEWSSGAYWGNMASLIREKGRSLIAAKIANLYGQIGRTFVDGFGQFLPPISTETTTETERRGPQGKTSTKTTKSTKPKGRGLGKGFLKFLKFGSKAMKM